ncbi:Myosin-2 [Nakaseomyces bracarensis]|uniref:Myosin-2 n=1 Tax=Nakaseomyces bracarensis TaxID=273131 RepID=A0ABR4NMM1_9SACH
MAFEVGTRCWYPSEEHGWIPCEVTKNEARDGKYYLEFVLEDGQVIDIDTDNLEYNDNLLLDDSSRSNLPVLRNPPSMESTHDLTTLSYLNEPAVLHAIKLRYSEKNIYTYSGIVLVATNPFADLPELYSNEMIKKYSKSISREELEPHLFAIAHDAYKLMTMQEKNQTIVVSGESGAGKTVSAKYIMRYFASLDENDNAVVSEMSEIEERILATNPIMEAFGNAKTVRNDNSSRFGKYLQIMFDDSKSIIGAQIRTYLLEKSRLVYQQESERNYHIFYQLLAGLPDSVKQEYCLSDASSFYYLRQGNDPLIPGIDDAKEFKETTTALSLIGIDESLQIQIFKILAALLHIGNVDIKSTSTTASVSPDEPNLKIACNLLGIDSYEFSKWLTKKEINTRSEKIVTNLKLNQALNVRDSVTKFIYSILFDWLVGHINGTLHNVEVSDKIKSFIGVLDIYGFEHFEKNSFEQFCINYANEKLQQEFNQHVFKLEQEEYVREQIEWSFIEFNDNQPCIDLIENKLGILSLLDEESRLPAGSDESWTEKLYQTLDKPPTNQVFMKPKFGQTKFVVSHYADNVEYHVEGFIDKNRDTVSESLLNVLKNTRNSTLQSILKFTEETELEIENKKVQEALNKPSVRTINKKPTLGSMFKKSLGELMEIINNTNVHYIRCVKPNAEKKAWEFDNLMVLSQLRACGILETIKISCAGFPSRWTFQEFIDRYYMLVPFEEWSKVTIPEEVQNAASVGLCVNILKELNLSEEKCQIGMTKLFFKAGVLAHLESLRLRRMSSIAIEIQKHVRAYQFRKQYLEVIAAVKNTQSYSRGKLIRLDIELRLKTRLALSIQALVRAQSIRDRIVIETESIIVIQCKFRVIAAKRYVESLRMIRSSVVIQKYFRSFGPRNNFKGYKQYSITIQSLVRRRLAIKHVIALRAVQDQQGINGITVNKLNAFVENTHSNLKEARENTIKLSKFSEELDKKNECSAIASKIMSMKEKRKSFGNKLETHKKSIKRIRESQVMENPTLKKMQEIEHEIKTFETLLSSDQLIATNDSINIGLGIDQSSLFRNSTEIDSKSKPNDYNLLQLFNNYNLLVKEILKDVSDSSKTTSALISYVIYKMLTLRQFLSTKQFISLLLENLHIIIIDEPSFEKCISNGLFWFTSLFDTLSYLDNLTLDLNSVDMRILPKLIEELHSGVSKMFKSWILNILNDLFRENDKIYNDFSTADISNVLSFKILQQKIKYIQSKMSNSQTERAIFGKLIENLILYVNFNVVNHLLIKTPTVGFEHGVTLDKNVDTLLEYCEELKLSNCRNSTREMSQMSKLLQIKVESVEELRVVCEYCFALNLIQIHSILAKYKVSSSEEKPIPYIVIKNISHWSQELKKKPNFKGSMLFRLEENLVKCSIDSHFTFTPEEIQIPDEMTLIKEVFALSQ